MRLALPAVVALLLAGCGVRQEQVSRATSALPLTILAPNPKAPELAPYYLAEAQGRFGLAGLAVAIKGVGSESAALADLGAGEGTLALVRQSAVLIARDRGLAVVGIASLDASAQDEPVLVARVRQAERNGEPLRSFLVALGGAAREVRENPSRAIAFFANGHLSAKARRSLEGTFLLDATPQPNSPYGYQDPASWSSLAANLYSRGVLTHDPTTLAPPYTNEFLPGEGI